MRSAVRWWIVAAGLLAVLAAGGVLVRGFPWLATGQPPRRADLMVVLGGGAGERFTTALKLWGAGMAPRILVTDGLGYPDRALALLQEGGVPRRATLAPPAPSRSTYEDALAIRQAVERYDPASILVVTSPYHCRRTRMILGRVLAGLPVRVTVTPSVSLYMDPDRWWQSHQGWITVGEEFPKLVWAWLTVPVWRNVGESVPAEWTETIDLIGVSPYITSTVAPR